MNENLKIITVSGKAQHGKDTFAQALCEELTSQGNKVLITHYADLLKYICRTFFNWDGNKDEKGRQILQYVGTDVVRKERPNYWVEFILSILELFGHNWDYVIIPDTRFPNEVEMLKTAYSNVAHIRVNRLNFENSLTEEQRKHPSETALDNIEPDFIFDNYGTIEDLKERIKATDWRLLYDSTVCGK